MIARPAFKVLLDGSASRLTRAPRSNAFVRRRLTGRDGRPLPLAGIPVTDEVGAHHIRGISISHVAVHRKSQIWTSQTLKSALRQILSHNDCASGAPYLIDRTRVVA
jgi:hypothetical protein